MSDLTAQMVFTADASGVEAGVGRAKKSLADLGAATVTEGKKAAEGMKPLGDESQKSSAKVEAATKNMIGSIQRTTAALDAGGRSGSKYFEALAAQRGISVDALKPYLAQLDAVNAKQKLAEQALNATAPALNNVGMSAKATAAAMRGVPAQFTDIVTSLQGGQAPLTVFLQQGGQLKDMFGGLAPATRAIGGYIAGLVNPFTVAAAAGGVLALAYYQATERTAAFNKSLVATGNYVGQSATSLSTLAEKIGDTIGTQSKAAEVLTTLASSGRIAGSVLEQVGSAVVAQNKAMGTSIEDAVAQYVKLADEPAKASVKLNETMHYLNQTTYERIRALEEQGNKEGAAALAQSTLASATLTRMQQVRQESGYLAQALGFAAREASNMWTNLSNNVASIGKRPTVAQLREELEKSRTGPLAGSRFEQNRQGTLEAQIATGEETDRLAQRSAGLSADRSRIEQARMAASQRLADQKKAARSRKEQRDDELDQLKRDAKTTGLVGKEYDDAVARINVKFKDPKGASPKAVQDDAATKFLETLRQTEASLSAQLAGENKLTDAQREQVKFQQLIADLKDKKILTAEQKSLLANKESISAQLERNIGLSNQIGFEEKIADIQKKSDDRRASFARQIEGIDLTIASGQSGRDEQSSRALDAFGLGDRARQMVDAQRSIRSEFQRLEAQATKKASDDDQLGSAEYKAAVVRIKDALGDALSAQSKYFDDLTAKQADWKNGATTALANYTDTIANTAGATEKALGDTFKGAEDALVQFATTGKLNVKSLADSIIAQLARIAIQQTITGPLAKGLMGAFQGDELLDMLKTRGIVDGASGGDASGGFLAGIGKAISGIFGGSFADGGTPPMGKVSLVGERGPELFVPSVPGSIVPNHALGGGGQSIVVHQSFTVGDVASMGQVRAEMKGSERRLIAGLSRSRSYGGAAG